MRMLASWLLVILSCVGCLPGPDYTHDSQASRAQQAESLKGFDDQVAGHSIEAYLGPRTGWILPADSALLSNDAEAEFVDFGGRAAAVSADGYYLTAYHVVEDGKPVMVLPPTSSFESGRKSKLAGGTCVISEGRIVKRFEPHDIALLKFKHRPHAYFQSSSFKVSNETPVFVGATEGFVFGEEKVGNGPFKARGLVLDVANGAGLRTAITSIPVHGGMSGTPCCDAEGKLVGILTSGEVSQLRYRTLSSNFVLVPMDELVAAIESDRKRASK